MAGLLEDKPGYHSMALALFETMMVFGAVGFLYVYFTIYHYKAAAVDWYLHHWTPWLRLDNFAGYSFASAFFGFISWRFLKNYWNLGRLGPPGRSVGGEGFQGEEILEPENDYYPDRPDNPPPAPPRRVPLVPGQGPGRGRGR